ncbi:MAG: MFS transporter permease [Desulfobacterium sp.]|nr:MFS transporter permease [Desulfobacterium sp.]
MQVNRPDVVVIPKEKTVFWMDGNGCWHNEFGKFEKKKIIDYFHAAIDRDAEGYFVQQEKDGVFEKAYFHHEDTALFVFHVILGESVSLRLNTGKEILLNPENLWIENDNLYLSLDGERVKFTDRSMMKISAILEEEGGVCLIRVQGRLYRIPEIHERDP